MALTLLILCVIGENKAFGGDAKSWWRVSENTRGDVIVREIWSTDLFEELPIHVQARLAMSSEKIRVIDWLEYDSGWFLVLQNSMTSRLWRIEANDEYQVSDQNVQAIFTEGKRIAIIQGNGSGMNGEIRMVNIRDKGRYELGEVVIRALAGIKDACFIPNTSRGVAWLSLSMSEVYIATIVEVGPIRAQVISNALFDGFGTIACRANADLVFAGRPGVFVMNRGKGSENLQYISVLDEVTKEE